jgi:hypothetical protein
MKNYLLLISLLVIIFAFFMEFLIVLGGGKIEDIENGRQDYLKQKSIFMRSISKSFYFFADHRPLLGAFGVIGLMVAIFGDW